MDDSEFQIIELEYQQASALFQRGFDLIFNLVRGFLYFNGIMLGIITIAFRVGTGRDLSFVIIIFSIIGATGGLMALIVHVRMAVYLRWWLQRASEIERKFSGTLFSHTFEAETSGRKKIFQSYSASVLLYSLF